MRSIWRIFSRPVYIPLIDKLDDIYRAFSPSGRGLFLFLSGVLIVSSVSLVYLLNKQLLLPIPGTGGSMVEGIVGSPRFINPVLAVSDADRDLSMLIYSGLLRATPEGGYENSLAERYSVSEDGRVYTVVLRENASFHDGKPVTSADVAFTVSRVQDPLLKSPLRASWDGVLVKEVDARTIEFTLKNAYAPFVENLTLGILPKHLWQNVSNEEFPFSELNTDPVGSGPFRVSSVARTPSGIPASYDLVPFSSYTPQKPYLSRLTLRFYQNESALLSALQTGEVDAGSGLSAALLSDIDGETVRRSPLNRVFGVFFNQNQSEVLRDMDVRRALEMAIDRNDLIEQVLGGYGTPLEGPVPPSIFEVPSLFASEMAIQNDRDTLASSTRAYLVQKGWKQGEDGLFSKTTGTGKTAVTRTLQFSLSTGNVPELRAAAEYLRTAWSAAGIEVDVKIFDQGDLSQNVIRPRKYDALLFGEVVGRELDLYAFWDSSQRNDPGLNIALYANATVDRVLSQLRETADEEERKTLYETFRMELEKDLPAIFLYAPDFVYSVPNDIKGLELGFIESPSDRFLNVAEWHRETDYVWPVFANK